MDPRGLTLTWGEGRIRLSWGVAYARSLDSAAISTIVRSGHS
jgi:hypothetical protein